MNRYLKTCLTVPCLLLASAACAGQPAPLRVNGAELPRQVVPTPPAPDQPAPEGRGLPFSDFLSDDEMGMLFDYLRDSFIAAVRNDPDGASMPPELAFKLEILKQRMLKEGDAAVRQLMQSMQQELEQTLQEYNQRLPQQPPQPPVETPPSGKPNRT